jgi:hypothetical protein
MNDDIEDDEIYDFSQENPEFPSKPPRLKRHRIRGALETARMWGGMIAMIWREWRHSKQDIEELRRREKRGGGSR